jgi:pre-mRNA-splicing factor CWC26
MSLADYLAKNYLTADSKREKSSRKRKRKQATDGLIIADDDATGWGQTSTNRDDDGPVTGKYPPNLPPDRTGTKASWQWVHAPPNFAKQKATPGRP